MFWSRDPSKEREAVYISSLSVLAFVYAVFAVLSIRRLAHLYTNRAPHSKSKKLFHSAVLAMSIGRFAQNILDIIMLALFNVDDYSSVKYDLLYSLEFILSASCAFVFALAYAMMLVFWGEFYWVIRFRKMPNTKQFYGKVNFYIRICQLSEGLCFCLVGFLLFSALRHNISSQSPNVNERAKYVYVIASVCTVLFLIRAVLLLIPIDYSSKASVETDVQASTSVPWWYNFSYYVICEIIPVALMLWFQRGAPKVMRANAQHIRHLNTSESDVHFTQEEEEDSESAIESGSEVEVEREMRDQSRDSGMEEGREKSPLESSALLPH